MNMNDLDSISAFGAVSGIAYEQKLSNIDDKTLAHLFTVYMIKFVPRSVTGLSLTKYTIPSNDTNKSKATKSSDGIMQYV